SRAAEAGAEVLRRLDPGSGCRGQQRQAGLQPGGRAERGGAKPHPQRGAPGVALAGMVQALPQEMEWIARILNGERDLVHELIRPYERVVFLTAVSVLRDAAEAEDVAQEAMIKAYRNLGSFRGDAKFSTWLTTITLNEARSRLRKSARVKMESLDNA